MITVKDVNDAIADLIVFGGTDGIFYGQIMSRITIKLVDDDSGISLTSLGFDKNTNVPIIYVNRNAFEQLNKSERRFVLRHEAQHLAHLHPWRANKRGYNVEKYGLASDVVLYQYGHEFLSDEPMPLLEQVRDLHRKLDLEPNQSAEVYYKQLPDGPSGNQTSGGSKGSQAANDAPPVPSHNTWDEFQDDFKNLAKETTKNMIRSIAHSLLGYGNMPSDIAEILDVLNRDGKLNWRSLLRMWTKQVRKYHRERSYLRESLSLPGLFPGFRMEPNICINVYADMSASISDDDATAFFTEIKGISRQLRAEVILRQFDVTVREPDVVDRNFNWKSVVRKARGGTSFECVRNHAADNKIKDIIVFTDGGAPEVDWGDINVLFVYPNSNHVQHSNVRGTVIEHDE